MLFVLIHIGFRLAGRHVRLVAVRAVAVDDADRHASACCCRSGCRSLIARNLKVEAIYERIPELVERSSARGRQQLMAGAGDALTAYLRGRRQAAAGGAGAALGRTCSTSAQARVRQLEPLTRIETFVDDADRDKLRDLTAIVNEKLDLDVHLSLQRALRLWLVTHIPAAMVLLGLLAGARLRGGVPLMARHEHDGTPESQPREGLRLPAAQAHGAVGVARRRRCVIADRPDRRLLRPACGGRCRPATSRRITRASISSARSATTPATRSPRCAASAVTIRPAAIA